MATAYRLNSPHGNWISVSRSNDGKSVTVKANPGDDSWNNVITVFDADDFLRFMTTVQKNWGK